MSVNFYNNHGVMVTLDKHKYKPAPPVFMHVVFSALSWPPSLFTKRVDTVTSHANKMIQSGLDLYLIPHIPLGTPPGAVPFPPQAAMIWALSGSVAYLAVHKVTGGGDQLACCAGGMLGMNVNCNDLFDLANGLVIQPNTVQTQPTPGDYLGAVVAYFLDAGLAFFVNNVLEASEFEWWVELIVQHLIRLVPNIPGIEGLPVFPRIILDPGGTGGPIIQKLIDGD
jgi:hypothetical protein